MLGFEKRFVQIGSVTPFKKVASVTLPFYIANSKFSDINTARSFFTNTKKKILSCTRSAGVDSSQRAGFELYNSFNIKHTADSFVNAELMILKDNNTYTVILRLFNTKASTQTGNMISPPTVTKNLWNLNSFTVFIKDKQEAELRMRTYNKNKQLHTCVFLSAL